MLLETIWAKIEVWCGDSVFRMCAVGTAIGVMPFVAGLTAVILANYLCSGPC